MQPHQLVFLKWPPNGWADRAEIVHKLWGILCTTYDKKNCQEKKNGKEKTKSQVIELWRRKRYSLPSIFEEIVFSAIQLVAIDLNGHIMRALGQKIATSYLWYRILTFRRKPGLPQLGWPLIQKWLSEFFVCLFVPWGPETDWDIGI